MIKKITFLFAICFSSISFSQVEKTAEKVEEIEIIEISEDSIPNEIPFAIIERVPIYPGCTGSTNQELKDCMSKKISELVGKNFNTNISTDIDYPPGRVKIFAQFTINKQGFVTNIRTRAPHPAFEKEIKRVLLLMERMEPGTQKGKNVSVLYSLPITFVVSKPEPTKEKKNRHKRN